MKAKRWSWQYWNSVKNSIVFIGANTIQPFRLLNTDYELPLLWWGMSLISLRLYHERMFDLVEVFSEYSDIIAWFLSFSPFMWYIIFINLYMLKFHMWLLPGILCFTANMASIMTCINKIDFKNTSIVRYMVNIICCSRYKYISKSNGK